MSFKIKQEFIAEIFGKECKNHYAYYTTMFLDELLNQYAEQVLINLNKEKFYEDFAGLVETSWLKLENWNASDFENELYYKISEWAETNPIDITSLQLEDNCFYYFDCFNENIKKGVYIKNKS